MDGYCGYYDDLNTGVEIDLLLSLRGSLLVWGGCSVGVLAEGVIASSSCSASLFRASYIQSRPPLFQGSTLHRRLSFRRREGSRVREPPKRYRPRCLMEIAVAKMINYIVLKVWWVRMRESMES
jgi:hypothetical protein